MIGRPVALVSFALVLGASARIAAQTPPAAPTTGRPHGVEVGVGLEWLGGFDIGSATALLPRNPATGSEPFTLFHSDGRQGAAAAFGATIGFNISQVVAVEAFGSMGKPTIRLAITQDPERSGPIEVSDNSLTEYALGGSLLVHWPRLTIAHRVVPFLLVGAGFFWQVAPDTSFETGHLIHIGGGARYVLVARPTRRLSAVGLRGDVRLIARDGGLGLDQRRRISANAGAALFVAF